MKTRQGFVSNSSSTSFVIALSKDFKITDDIIKEFIRESGTIDESEVFAKRIKSVIKKMCEKGLIFSDPYSSKDSQFFEDLDTLIEVCPDIVISEIDGGPESGSTYVNIFADKTLAKIKKMLDKG